MSMSESVTEFSEVLSPYFPPPTSPSVRVGGLVVVVGSCGGTDSATYKLLLHPFCLPPSSYVANEWCMKCLRPAFCWKGTYRSVLRATITTTVSSIVIWNVSVRLLKFGVAKIMHWVLFELIFKPFTLHHSFIVFRLLTAYIFNCSILLGVLLNKSWTSSA